MESEERNKKLGELFALQAEAGFVRTREKALRRLAQMDIENYYDSLPDGPEKESMTTSIALGRNIIRHEKITDDILRIERSIGLTEAEWSAYLEQRKGGRA